MELSFKGCGFILFALPAAGWPACGRQGRSSVVDSSKARDLNCQTPRKIGGEDYMCGVGTQYSKRDL